MEKHQYINPNITNEKKQRPIDIDSEEPQGQGTGRPPLMSGIRQAFVKYAERGSMTGVSYIHQSKNRAVKIVWSCLLLAACACMTFHLYT
ncbi:hypothetical protein PoB_003433200 [Plakobranchus ocellatus]|uniref:Uncharacterized protein n=1 Tax=Plakobranchus ocellatus TaxID=259542 RepID=A0AAV4ALM0_9GAST|nr:hypothetical protein PoB_003433200 [Plakobranchus ocellatus]